MEITAFLLWSCAVLPLGDADAPQIRAPVPVPGPVRELRIGGGSAKSAPLVIYANTGLSGFYQPSEAGREWIDWGVVGPSNDHDTVTELSFGYATTAPSTRIRLRTYDGYTGHCAERGTPLFDLELTGLPGSPGGGVVQGWVISLDLTATGDCFYQPEGPLGYSYTFSEAVSGPLFARGGAGQENLVEWVSASGAVCGLLNGGPMWYGFYAEYFGHDGNDTYGVGCGGLAGLTVEGNACTGGALTVTAEGPAGGFAAFAIGVTFGPGYGGPIGNCTLDVVPIVPIMFLGTLSGPPLVFGAEVGLPSGGQLCAQFISNDPATGRIHLSPTEIVSVP